MLLQITNLKSGYNQMEVLKGLDFEVGENEIVAVIGPNGSGKSTLLKSIFNLCEIYGGSIKFDSLLWALVMFRKVGKFLVI